MYFHIQANGQIVETEQRLEDDSVVNWQTVSDKAYVAINCPDEDTAKYCLREFRRTQLQSQLG